MTEREKLLETLKVAYEPRKIPQDDGSVALFYPTDEDVADMIEAAIIDEYKHRAEVAEKELEKHKRAFDKAVKLAYKIRTDLDVLSCSSCEFGYAFDVCKKIRLYSDCENRWKEELFQQAEREIEEEERKE